MTGYALTVTESELLRYRMMAEHAQHAEAELWTAAGVAPGAAVADVGCGPGAVAAVLADAVGETGRLAAVDADQNALAVARSTLTATGLGNWSVQIGSADSTGLEARAFDVVMIRHVLAHNGGREQAIVDHAASLLKPGGVVYLVDVDLTTTKVHPSDTDLDDLLNRYVQFHRARGNDPEIGLELRRLLEHAGLTPIDYRGRIDIIDAAPGTRPPPWAAREAMVTAGAATADDIARWEAALERFDRIQPRPIIFPTIFIALGRYPDTTIQVATRLRLAVKTPRRIRNLRIGRQAPLKGISLTVRRGEVTCRAAHNPPVLGPVQVVPPSGPHLNLAPNSAIRQNSDRRLPGSICSDSHEHAGREMRDIRHERS